MAVVISGKLSVHNKLASSAVNGPGDRAVLWLQGCILNCPGCWNPDTHAFNTGLTPTQEIFDWVLQQKGKVEGVTFSGGEPMHQAWQLLKLCEAVHILWPECSFGMFTGYTYRELESGHFTEFAQLEPGKLIQVEVPKSKDIAENAKFNASKLWNQLKRQMDWAIMGRYVKTLPSNDPMLGSRNQEIHLFATKDGTHRYGLGDFKPQQVELQISENGLVEITGFPRGDLYDERVV